MKTRCISLAASLPVLAAALPLAAGAGAPDFSAPAFYPTIPGTSFDVAAADIDGDGRPDLAVANLESAKISVLVNRGDGSFSPARSLAVGMSPIWVEPADLDGDGQVDLAVADSNSGSNAVWVLFARGGGDFLDPVPLATAMSSHCVRAADLDTDGRPDLIAGEAGSYTIALLWNGGNRSFGPVDESDSIGINHFVATGDLDGDGYPDIVTAGGDLVAVHLHVARRAFRMAPFGVGETPRSVAIADLDGDGVRDVAIADWRAEGRVNVVWNDGSAAFDDGFLSLRVGSWPSFVVAVDGGRPGAADLVVADGRSEDVTWAVNEGGRSFSLRTIPIGRRPLAVAVADLDGDGSIDLVVSNEDATVGVCLQRAAAPRFVRGDANADGGIDIADPIWIVYALFLGGPPAPCRSAADVDDDGAVSITDVIGLVSYLFRHGPAPRAPFPACGTDPTAGDPDCERFGPCE